MVYGKTKVMVHFKLLNYTTSKLRAWIDVILKICTGTEFKY
ncbi:MAG: hypothetical protein ACP5RS_05715 [Thermoplasmata archaeon]